MSEGSSEISPKETLPPAFQDSELLRMKAEQAKRGIKFTALVSDYENSYFNPKDVANTRRLADVLYQYNVPVIIVTGLSHELLMEKINENNHRKPQVIIGSTGTEVWVLHTKPDGTEYYVRDEEFDLRLTAMPYDRRTIAQTAQELIDTWSKENAPESSRQFNFQKPEVERSFIAGATPPEQKYKLSYYFYSQEADRNNVEDEITAHFPNVQIATCEEIHYNRVHQQEISTGADKKYCVDMLPVMPKAYGVNYVEELMDIVRSFKVGDSGNDERFMSQSVRTQDAGVIAGEAKPELPTQLLNATPIRIGDTGFVREGQGEERRKYYNVDSSGTGTVAAGSIIEAAVKRLQVTLRFEKDQKMKTYIQEIIDKLQAPS